MTGRIVCDCGTNKRLTANDLRVCAHCDQGCELKRCDACAKYNSMVSRRINA
jgi:hypothetical protein